MFDFLSNIISSRMEQEAMDRRAAEANAASIQQTAMANQANRRAASVAWKRDRRMYDRARADNRRDAAADFQRNLTASRENSATDYERALAAMDKANAYTRAETEDARAYDRQLRAEERALAESDVDNQFVKLRDAAEKAGLNPLSVLGMGSGVPSISSLQSSTFGASASAPSAQTAFAPSLTPGAVPPTASVPMSYGAPVFVAPTASNSAVLGSVSELGRELTSTAAHGKAFNDFNQAVERIEQERAGAFAPMPVVAGPNSQPGATVMSPTGPVQRPSLTLPQRVSPTDPTFLFPTVEDMGRPIPLDPGRPVDVAEATDSGLFGRITTHRGPIDILTVNGEIPDLEQAAALAVMSVATPENRRVVWGEDGLVHDLMRANGLAVTVGPAVAPSIVYHQPSLAVDFNRPVPGPAGANYYPNQGF